MDKDCMILKLSYSVTITRNFPLVVTGGQNQPVSQMGSPATQILHTSVG
jgi:hypothetical protein